MIFSKLGFCVWSPHGGAMAFMPKKVDNYVRKHKKNACSIGFLLYLCINKNGKTMSKYYNINGLKVRVSDHEPNFSMERFRGRNDVEFYTVSADNRKLSVIDQIEHYCDKHDLDPALFAEVAKDFPDPKYIPVRHPKKIEVTQKIVDGYRAITGKGSMRKKEKYCERVGVDSYKMSQGYYTIKG